MSNGSCSDDLISFFFIFFLFCDTTSVDRDYLMDVQGARSTYDKFCTYWKCIKEKGTSGTTRHIMYE